MDEFQPEDELKPDASDRPAARSRKSSPGPKLPISKQHIMIAVGILVLLLLILGIGSALKSPSGNAPSATAASSAGNSKDIDLSGSAGMSSQSASASPTAPATAASSNSDTAPDNGTSGHDISMPAISSTPSQGNTATASTDQQRVTVAGDMNNALNNAQIPAAADTAQTSLPTAPATLDRSGKLASAPSAGSATPAAHSPTVVHRAPQTSVGQANERKAVAAERARERENRRVAEQRRTEEQRRIAEQRKVSEQHKTAEHRVAETSKSAVPQAARPAKREPAPVVTQTAKPVTHPASQLPAGEYTLQLSGATRQDALNTWAKQQKLSSYHVYQTERNGKPWYVLISGSYATSAEAKRAISSLPEGVRSQNPWVKPLSQVRKESGK